MNKYKKLLGALLGTVIEHYDYSLYGFSATIIASKFFPSSDPLASLANAFAVYAVSYFSKPLGSIIFGTLGDKFGRKFALNITIIGIVIPTVTIGLLPTHDSFCIFSILILVICRIMQGIFTAGEYDGAAIYVIEHLGEKYRNISSALTRATAATGLLLGIITTNFFNSHIFGDFGWRIPFLLSLPLGLITLYYRTYLIESLTFANLNNVTQRSITSIISRNWPIMLSFILLFGGAGVTYQISIIFMKQYLPIMFPTSSLFISSFSILLVACFTFAMPITGFLADRYGIEYIIKVACYSAIIACILAIMSYQFIMLNLMLFSLMLLVASIATFNGLTHGFMIRHFNANERYRAISLCHTTGSMLLSSSTNYLCLTFVKNYNFILFPIIYVLIFTVIIYIITVKIGNK